MAKGVDTWKWRIVKAGHTQASFCKRFDVSQSQLSEWLTGKKQPTTKNIKRIELYLGCLGV